MATSKLTPFNGQLDDEPTGLKPFDGTLDGEKPKENIIGDFASTVAKGLVSVPEALVGLADIPTGGRVGKFLENEGGLIGFRPKQAKEYASSWESDATKQARQEFDQAEGLVGKAQAALSNPRLIAMGIGESVPSMLAGGALARTAGMALPSLAGRVGLTAAGEGAVMAGSQAEQIRQQTEDGLLTGKQAGLAAATGVVGGTLGALGGRAAKALGVGDVDQMAATGIVENVSRPGLGIASRAGRGALTEGVFEELPQSLAETGLQNLALDRPFTQDMDSAAVMGTLTGGAMGAGAGVLSGMGQRPQAQPQPAPVDDVVEPVESDSTSPGDPPRLGFNPLAGTPTIYPDGTVALNSEQEFAKRNPKPSEAMGIDRAAGPLSRAAADAVDSGASPAITPTVMANPLVQAAQAPAPTPPVVDAASLKDRTTEELRGFLRNAQDTNIRKAISSELARRKREEIAAMPDPLQQSLIDQPKAEKPRAAEAPQAVQSQPQAPQEQPRPLASLIGGRLTDTDAADLVSKTRDPLRGVIQAEPRETGIQGAADGLSDTGVPAVTGAGAGDTQRPSGVSDAGRVRGRPGKRAVAPADAELAQGGADRAGDGRPGTGDGTAALNGRPSRWRQNALQAKKVARELGLNPDGKRLAEIVAEVDAFDARAVAQNSAPQRRQELLDSLDGLQGSTRRDAIDYRIDRLREEIAGLRTLNFTDEPIAIATQQIEDLQAIRAEAVARDDRDLRQSIQRNMLQGERDELNAAVRNGEVTQDQADAIVERARATGNTVDAVGSIQRDLEQPARAIGTNVQDTPQGTERVQTQAPADQAPEAARGDGAEAGRVPDTRAGDGVRADGVEGYSLPEGDVWRDWRRSDKGNEHPEYEPSARQRVIMASVERAIDDGVFYNKEMTERVAKELGYTGPTDDGSVFKTDVYLARGTVEAKRKYANQTAIANELNLKAGDNLGTLIFNDFKVTTGVTVESVSKDGRDIKFAGKRGPARVSAQTQPESIKAAIDRAHEKGKRKDTYAEFVASRQQAKQPTAQETKPAEKKAQEPKAEDLPEGWTATTNGFTGRPVYRFTQDIGQPFAVVTKTDFGYEVQIRQGDKLVSSANMNGAAKFEALDKATQMLGEAGMATHKDPGEKAEPATKAVVTDAMKTAAKNEETKPSEMRKWLLGEIDKALLNAPDRADYDDAVKRMGEKDAVSMFTGNGFLGKNAQTGFVTFDVPGDGKFKVRNSVRGLLEFRKNVSASLGFKDSGQKTVKPEQNEGVRSGSGGQMAAITNMIDEGDFEAARDYAEAVGIKLEDVKVPRGERASEWSEFMKTGKVPEQRRASREWTITNEQNPNGTWSKVGVLKRMADGVEYVATVRGDLDGTNAKYVMVKDGKETGRMTSSQPFSRALEMAEDAMPEANDKPAPSEANDTGWNMAGTGYGGKRYRGRNITTADGREIVARIYENAGNYEEVEVKVDGVRKFTVRDSYNAQDKADAFIKTLTEGEQEADGPAAQQDAPAGRTYLAVPFKDKDYAKRAGAKWDDDKKLWYADPVGGDGLASGEININLQQFIPNDYTTDDRFNYYSDKAVAEAVALNASARDGVEYEVKKRKHPDGIMLWSAVKSGEQSQGDSPTIPEGYKPAGEPFYRGGKQIQGYAPFSIGERVTMKDSAGQSGVIESLTSPDDAGVFSGALVKFDNGMEQIVSFGKLQAASAPVADAKPMSAEQRRVLNESLLAGTISVEDYMKATGLTDDDVGTFGDGLRRQAEQKAQQESQYYQLINKMHEALTEQMKSAMDAPSSTPPQRKAKQERMARIDRDRSTLDMLARKFEHPFDNNYVSKLSPALKSRFARRFDGVKTGEFAKRDFSEASYKAWAELLIDAANKKNPQATPQQQEAAEPFEHAGLKIRQSRVRTGDEVETRWIVQSPENAEREARGERQISGDRIVESREAAIRVAEQEVKRYADEKASKAEFDRAEQEAKAATEARKEVNRGKTLAERRADAILDKPTTLPPSLALGAGTKRETMQRAVEEGRLIREVMVRDTAAKKRDEDAISRVRASGYILGLSNENIPVVKAGLEAQARLRENKYEKPEYRVYAGRSENDFFREISKTEYDYAQSLKRAAEQPQQADKQGEATDDRDTFTLTRLNRETNQMEPVTFKRGEYVRYMVGKEEQFGDIDGISQARREFSVDGLWYPMAYAYKAERPAAPERKDMVPMSKVIEKMNAKNGEGLTDADRVPEQKPASKTPTVDRHSALMQSVREGKATADQFKAEFESLVENKAAVVAELDTMTKAELLKAGGYFIQMRYANEKKGEIIDAIYRQMVSSFVLGDTLSYGMGKGAFEAAVRKHVEATDDAKLEQYAKDRQAAIAEAKAERAAKAAALENPQTLADFKAVIAKHISEGKSSKEAFLSLTPEQRIQFDTLAAEETKDARETRKRMVKTEVRAANQTTGGEIIATKHTRDGYDLFVVQLADRLSKDDYTTVLASAKRMGGWYSSFRGNGAIPGFQFKSRESADAFLKLAAGDTSAAQEQAQQRRDAFEDDRSQSAVERLREMAEKIEDRASEDLSRERKTNTARRARFAAAAERAAEAEKAMARTMRNIAQAIEEGRAKFLDAVRTKSQVDMLTSTVRTAKDNELRAKYDSYAEQEKRRGEPPTAETADFAEFPSYTAFRSDLATLGRQMLEVDGTKKLGQRLMSVADDVSDAYMDFAKENIGKVSQFMRGDDMAVFASRDQAERAIKRSNLTGKAIVLPVKRGDNRIILSPSEAINRGVWTGDGDKRITLTADFGKELVEAIGARGNKTNGLSVPWQFQNTYDRRKALARIGIESPSEFRSALREFIALQERATANKVRELELKMVGRKNDGLDFFPTPAEIADQMVEAADIKPDMAVLEPSAGMGHIADRIRAAGAEPDVIEISPERRELLLEKGYNTQDVNDFTDLKPREFYTFGDVFRAPDGTEGIMSGSGGMASNRVGLYTDGDRRFIGWFNRDELTGVRHRGSDSGYDRIIMNPPFSNRRDAEHVQHAYTLLKPGGRIVAIMGEGVFFGSDKKAQDFRDWLDSVGGTSEKLPAGSFMDPSLPVNTGVSARMVVIDKPAGDVQLSIAGDTDLRISNPTTASTTYAPAPSPQQAIAARVRDAINDHRARNGSGAIVWNAVVPPDGAAGATARSVAGLAKRLFGREVIYVKFDGPALFNGAVSKLQPGTIFLNIESKRPLMAVLGHELLHELAKSNPGTYANLSRRLNRVMRNQNIYSERMKLKYRTQGQPLPTDILEELEADIVGDNFMDPAFWQEVAREQPGTFRAIANQIMRWLDNLAQRITRMRPFGTDEFLTDIAAARSAVADAMREFSQNPNAPAQADDAGLRFSIADAAPNNDREVVKPVVQLLNDTFKVRGKLSWWHKTVGTPFNLAQRVPEFKRVFDAVQNFINDVSFYGAEAAAKAPKIIPKLETWKDLGKSPISAEDNKAIAAPIFEGTLVWMRDESGRPVKVEDMRQAAAQLTTEQKAQRLLRNGKIRESVLKMWKGLPADQFDMAVNSKYDKEMLNAGVVWTDAELRNQFKLTDEQIGLYREFREATDKSLVDLALSDIIQYAGKDIDPIKEVIMGRSLAEGSEMVRDYLMDMAEANPERRNDLLDTANGVIDKANRVQQLIDRGYAPLQRFGRYTVYAKDENGEQLFFGMYENRWDAARATRQMRQQFPGATIETGMMSEEAYKLFQGISPETLEIFGTMLGMDSQADGATNEAFQQYLKLAKSNRSAMKRLIERKGIAGYSEDASRVLASFLYSNARQTASNLHVGEILNGVNDIPKDMGDAKDMAMKLARYTMDPQEEAQALRGLLFAQYLGGSIASAMINALQPAQVTFPYLSQFVGVKKSATIMAQAVKDALKRSTGDARLDAALKKAEEDGVVSPQEIFQLMAQAQGKATLKAGDGTKAGDAMAAASNTLSRLSLGWGKVFSIPEQFNRRSTFIAAYRAAMEKGDRNPAAFAEQAVKETQFVYNKGNRPAWARGSIGALAFTFKTYSISYVELLQRMAKSGPEGRRAAMLMVGVLFLMAGAGGLPGVEDAEDVVDGIAQRVFGLNFQTRQKRQEWLAELFGEGGARFIENGLSGLPWSPTDVSGRLGIGNLIPGTGIFVKKQDYTRDVSEIAGPAADMTKRFLQGAGLLLQGEVLKAGEIVSPVAIRNMIQGGRMAATDQYTDARGRKVIDTTMGEAALKTIGFQPANVARVQDATRTVQQMVALNKIRESEIADKWAKAIVAKDQDGIMEAQQEMRDWNQANPDSPIRIDLRQIRKRVQALREDKTTRIERTAPKEIRQEVRRELEGRA